MLFVDRRQRTTTVKDPRAKFADVGGDETRSGNRAWLIRRIAWRMQANHEGGLAVRVSNSPSGYGMPA
ncbi:MAG: hypothetical protein ACKOEO_08080 [Planctomycetaceae bacterium]